MGNNILIAWYGNDQAASVVIEELRAANEKQPLSIDQIKFHLDVNNIKDLVGNYVIGDNNTVGFTGFFIDNNQMTHEFESFTGNQKPKIKIPLPQNLGNIKLYGSGGKDVQEYFTENLDRIKQKICQSKDIDELIYHLYLRRSSYFLGKKICNGDTMMQYYGGLYDFAAIGNGELLKPSEHA